MTRENDYSALSSYRQNRIQPEIEKYLMIEETSIFGKNKLQIYFQMEKLLNNQTQEKLYLQQRVKAKKVKVNLLNGYVIITLQIQLDQAMLQSPN